MITETQHFAKVLDRIIKQEFPEYWKKTKHLSKTKREKVWILSQEEINELHSKYKSDGDLAARDRLIYSQLKLVFYFAMKFHFKNNGTSLSPEDLLGFANEILIGLIDVYDPYKDKTEEEIEAGEFNKFPSFIQTWLTAHLHKRLKDYGLEIRLPHNQISDITLQKRYRQAFEKRFGRTPSDGEAFELYERVSKRKTKVLRRITFELSKKLIIVESFKDGEWVSDKEVKSTLHMTHTVSGNQNINDDGDEIFDLMQGELSIPLDDNKKLIYSSLKNAIDQLDIRDRESIMFKFFKKESNMNIPSLLTPDYSCQKEVNSLAKTSFNEIDIYIHKNNEKIHLKYDIVANFHVANSESDAQEHSEVEFLTHGFMNKNTNLSLDKYRFGFAGATKIEVTHTTCDATNPIKFTYDGRIINFCVNYQYGAIFTPQTFKNKTVVILKKLRKQLKRLKNQNY